MRSAFTLIELLVVIAIISVLAIVVILTLNPGQLILQARDSNRLSDLASIQSAIGILQADQPSASLGSSTTVYPSLPDSTATTTGGDQCQGLGLLSLPGSYGYHCAASSSFRSNTNTGWIPVNFSSLSSGSPLGQLPVDPVNASSSRLYYTYVTNGQKYELTAGFESSKYKLGGSNDVIGTDGGTLATVYEKGSQLGLEPLDYGDPNLVGLWTFDEGAGTIAYDYSGMNATGSWGGTLGSQWTGGRVGNSSGLFNGSNNFVNLSTASPAYTVSGAITISAWLNATSWVNWSGIIEKSNATEAAYGLSLSPLAHNLRFNYNNFNPWPNVVDSNAIIPTGAWIFGTYTYDGNTVRTYVNGSLDKTATIGNITFDTCPTCTFSLGQDPPGSNEYFNGAIDDVRIYNRALSASEVQALYNGGK